MKGADRLGTAAFVVAVAVSSIAHYSWAKTGCDRQCLNDARSAEIHYSAAGPVCWCFDKDNRAYRPGANP
jgi:hypothetical protein